MCAGAHHPTQVVFDDGGDTARSNHTQVASASGIVAHATVFNGAVTRGSAQSSSTGRHNRRLHGALLLNCAYPSGTVAVSERECSRLIGFDALTATCQNAMAAIERSASAELLAHRPLALVCSPCIGDNSVLGTVSHLMAPMSLLTQSKPRKIEVEFMGLIPKFAYHFRLAKPRDFL
jgi:hypothetical protein